MKVAVIGGTGKMGRAIARHLAKANSVIIGSRDTAKAKSTAEGIKGAVGADYHGAASAAEAIVLAIPYSALGSLAGLGPDVSGKLVVSMVNPISEVSGILTYGARELSAAEELARLLPGARVATAFNNVPSGFFSGEVVPPVDILIAAESKETYEEAAKLVAGVKEMRPLYAGPLSEARIVEGITSLVLNLAKLNGTGSLSTKFVTRKG